MNSTQLLRFLFPSQNPLMLVASQQCLFKGFSIEKNQHKNVQNETKQKILNIIEKIQ